ncbi:MAG: DNA-directed RNA polymerase subunit omega [Bdellovibrionales bacterium]|nr:DNA-directed RNA polymerase subunit omega [Bdellovibrionales bacterium]
MARITVEDCLENEPNRFSLVMLASRRAKQLLLGKTPVTDTKGNKCIVSALREIASGKVQFIEREKIEAELAAGQLTSMSDIGGESEGGSAEVSIDSAAGGSA